MGDPPALPDVIKRSLSLPREAGTPAAAAARDLIAAHLSSLGYEVTLQRFSFSPSSLNALPVFGAGLGALALVVLPFLFSPHVPAWSAAAVWLTGLSALGVLSVGIGLGWVSSEHSIRQDANLVATRGKGRPRRWIVAHLDSKAQGHSMAGRLVAVWVLVVATGALTLLTLFRLVGEVAPLWLASGVGLAPVAGWLASRGRLRGFSPGARDNASGIVAALAAAGHGHDPGTGILITGAEEFGLVGARIFAQLTPEMQELEFLNLDTLDDQGRLYLVSHDARGERLARSLESCLSGLGLPLRHRRLPWGIFVDSAPLARAGAASITLGRLTWATLRRIHTPADTAEDFTYRTAEAVGKALVS